MIMTIVDVCTDPYWESRPLAVKPIVSNWNFIDPISSKLINNRGWLSYRADINYQQNFQQWYDTLIGSNLEVV